MATTPVPVYVKPIRQIIGLNYAGSIPGASSQPLQNGTLSVTTNLQEVTIIADAVIEEIHDDEMVITEQPVEQGAVISDHAYKLPAQLDLTYAWSAGSPQNSSPSSSDPLAFLKSIYQQFLGLEVARVLCSVYTGKRLYNNMLIRSLGVRSDRDEENSLIVRVRFQEILLATTQTVTIAPQGVNALPQQTAPVVNQGAVSLQSAPTYNLTVPPVAP